MATTGQWNPGGGSQPAGTAQQQGQPPAVAAAAQGPNHPNLPPPPYPSHSGGPAAPLKVDNDSFQALYKSIRLVQKLRSSVSLTFRHLADGVHGASLQAGLRASSGNLDGSALDGLGAAAAEDEKTMVEDLKRDLKQVTDALTDVENTVSLIQDQSPQQHYSKSASFLLPLDSVGEKHRLSTQLYQSHRWLDKLHELSSVSVPILSQNLTRRSVTAQRDTGNVAAAKRLKLKPPTAQQVSVAQGTIDQVVGEMSRQFKNTMTIKLSRPLGNPALLNITLARTLKAFVILRGFIIEWVNVIGYGELHTRDLDIPGTGPEESSTDASLERAWTKSQHLVFKRISDHAAAAMIHFYLPNNPELALRSFLMWLNSYEKLFYDPCYACHKIVQSADGSVPVFRDLRTLKPYHDLCRP